MDKGRCPRCGALRSDGTECGHCGVLYAKAEAAKQEKDAKRVAAAQSKLTQCKECGKDVSKNAVACPHCGEGLIIHHNTSPALDSRQLIGITGCCLLFFGTFAPLVTVPIMGSINYFNNGKGDGIFVLALAAVSLIVVLKKRYRNLYLTGGASLAMLVFSYWNFHKRMGSAKAEMAASMVGNPFGGMATAAMDSVQLQWGWAVMIIGAILLIVSASMTVQGE